MKKLCASLLVMIVIGTGIGLRKAASAIEATVEPVQLSALDEEVSVVHTGVSSTPPWIQLDPPWSPGVTFVDLSNRNDTWISMDVDATGRFYVVYQTPWTGTGVDAKYGWGVATSTNQGLTWDNRVYRITDPAFTMIMPDVDITDNGKIWIWGTLQSPTRNFVPAFMRSSMTCYNNPDSLRGVSFFNIPLRYAPECATYGNGNNLVIAQYTVDRPAAGADSVAFLFSHDTVSFFQVRFRPPGGNVGMTSIAINVNGGDTMLTHAVEFVDSAGSDRDVVWYHDTMGIFRLWGISTTNPRDDRYPSVFGDQYSAYIAFQGDIGAGNNEIFFTYSIDWGATWDLTLQNISNNGANEQYPRLHGAEDIIGCAYNHGINNVFFNYSAVNGMPGTWQTTPEVVNTGATADTGYHCIGLLFAPQYYYCAWEDTRNMATDSIDIYISQRTTPIGVFENKHKTINTKTMLVITPNPFNDHTYISYGGFRPASKVSLKIYNAQGRLVRTFDVPGGRNAAVITWDGRDQQGIALGAGVYFCELNMDNSYRTEKIIRVR